MGMAEITPLDECDDKGNIVKLPAIQYLWGKNGSDGYRDILPF